jgi:hypothetical protein
MFDVAKMTDEELRLANAEIDAEILKRARLEEERLWNNFVDAFRAYCEKFGDIEIQDDCTIYLNPNDFDLQSFGEITPRY